MTHKYRMFRRHSGVYFIQDNETGKQESLRTKNKGEAERLIQAKNEAHRQPAINVQIARAYLMAADPKLVTRTWQEVMDAIVLLKRGTNRERWERAIADRSFDSIRRVSLMETRSDHFLKVLEEGKVSSNLYLRRIHNHALAMDWLLKPVIPKRSWPKVHHKAKRAITAEEHRRVVEREKNPERQGFYRLCWYLSGSQMDVATLTTEDVDWTDRTICYERWKFKNHESTALKPPLVHFGDEVAAILALLPTIGPLFPNLCQVQSKDRANEFRQRCHGLGIVGISLHSYGYAWAERARQCGFPQRFAQESLGHNSKAVHAAYAKKAEVRVPSLEEWERQMKGKIIEFQAAAQTPSDSVVQQKTLVAQGL